MGVAVNRSACTALANVMPVWGDGALVGYGDMLMQEFHTGISKVHVALALGTLAVAGCVPRTYVQDYPPTYYSGGGYGYYPAVPPGYYGYTGYYGPAGYPPRVVYVDHDHDRNHREHGSGHEGGKDGDGHEPGHVGHGDGRNDHDRNDRAPGRSDPDHTVTPPGVNPDRPPPRLAPPHGSGPSPKVPPGRSPCAVSKKSGTRCGTAAGPATRTQAGPAHDISLLAPRSGADGTPLA